MTRHSHPIASPDDQKVTFVELFFDLVFAYCVTQVVTLSRVTLIRRVGFPYRRNDLTHHANVGAVGTRDVRSMDDEHAGPAASV
jgi:hypothetical protein